MQRHPIASVRRILLHPRGGAHVPTRHAAAWCLEQGVQVAVPEALLNEPDAQLPQECTGLPTGEIGAGLDLAVALGGDGTLLRASRWVADHGVPVVGINLGDLGFLSAFTSQQTEQALQAAVAGELVWEPRERMQIEIVRDGVVCSRQIACNDLYLGHGEVPRMLQLVTTVGGQPMAAYRADGLIVSTPMGSTAYNLSAGGPIVAPGTDTVIITPICPHSLTHRPVVTSAASSIVITYAGARGGGTAMASVDGQWMYPLEIGDQVVVRQAKKPLKLVPPHASVFDVLAAKLGWSGPA